jgi:hypothetical protein
MNLVVSIVAMVLGLFFAVSPNRAAKIWGTKQLENLAPEHRAVFLKWYRVFGIVLCLGGALFAIDSITFSNYHR